MNKIHLGTAALNTTPKDWKGNRDLILDAIAEAQKRGVTLLCLPELAVTGYGCEDEFHAAYVSEWAMRILLEDVVPKTMGIAVALGLPLQFEGCVYNAIALIADCKVLGFVTKQNLAGDGIHYEPRFFKPWPNGVIQNYPIGDLDVPIGDLVFELNGVRVGFEICEDAWVANRPGIQHAQQAIDVILNPSASHFSFAKFQTRRRFVEEGSRAFQCAYVYANLLGNEAGRAIYDGDCLIATEGRAVKRSQPFSYHGFTLTDAVVNLDANRVLRNRRSSYTPDLSPACPIVRSNFTISCDAATTEPHAAETDLEMPKEEEFHRAVGLGLFDYLRKSRTRGFAISLSGGADSAACLALVCFMVKELLENYPDHPYLKHLGFQTDATIEVVMRKICVCAYQGTVNSSDETLGAAEELAKGLGARFTNINVQALVDEYESILASYLERDLSWDKDDITRQNIQARCRAPSIWAIANAENFLLLSTSNRSEAAVGYCTMDGDTAGSLSPIAGIDKAFLRHWLKWSEENGMRALAKVNALTPTAELRPQAAGQTDEDDLMPYPILNRIQKLAVVQKMSPEDIFEQLIGELFPEPTQVDRQKVYYWLSRYFQLWSRNQWKRERYAPSFHLDDENLDPRSWCRYPILSGGYVKELAELATKYGIESKL